MNTTMEKTLAEIRWRYLHRNEEVAKDGGPGSGPPLGNQNAYKGGPKEQESNESTGTEAKNNSESAEFQNTFLEARETQPLDKRWRVDDSYELKDYDEMQLHTTSGGSTYAIHDGDIVSVCKNINDTETSGKALMRDAVANGGVKLDSYEGNHGFYTKCGFEPVSWCKWEDKYAPSDWCKVNGVSKDSESWFGKSTNGNAAREDIIFYKYTGKNSTETAEQFKSRVAASKDYDEAKDVREKSLKK